MKATPEPMAAGRASRSMGPWRQLSWPLIVIVAMALVACQARNPQQASVVSAATTSPDIVAYLADEPVTAAQWQQARAYAQATLLLLGEPESQLDEQSVFQSFLEDLMLERAAAKAGYQVSSADVSAEERRMIEVAGAGKEKLAEILAQVGLSDEAWATELSRSVLAGNYLEDVVLAGVTPDQRTERRRVFLQELRAENRLQTLFLPEPLPGLRAGNQAPDFEVSVLGADPIRLSQLRGKGVILNFWATWCVPCRAEMPLLQKTAAEHAADGLVVLGVNVGEDDRAVQRFAEELGLSFPLGLDQQEAVTHQYRVYGMPTTFFIDRQGVIHFLAVGPIDQQLLDRELPAILAES